MIHNQTKSIKELIMDQKKLFRQMLEFNKTAFDNNFKAMSLFQSQSEQYILRFLNQANWIPEENKKMTTEWLSTYRNSYENFKVCADENYRKIMDSFAGPQAQAETQK